MNIDERREAFQQLEHAWKQAAVGATEQAEQYVCRALHLLDYAVTPYPPTEIFVGTVRLHIQEGRAAIEQSDLLGAMLALHVALKALEQLEHKNCSPPQTCTSIKTNSSVTGITATQVFESDQFALGSKPWCREL